MNLPIQQMNKEITELWFQPATTIFMFRPPALLRVIIFVAGGMAVAMEMIMT